jgi:homoserine dehydrogenase
LSDRLAQQHDLSLRICGIATRRHGAIFAASGVDGIRAADVVASNGPLHAHRAGVEILAGGALELIDRLSGMADDGSMGRVVIETTPLDIHTGQPAINHIERALDRGLHVVTANKGPVAIKWNELDRAARKRGASFLFEGAVMDGIPVFNFVRETLPAVTITAFRGVLNSTTNHIITALEDGGEFGPALEAMQQAGIAEADPSLDVDGWDAAAKAAALANVLMGAHLTPAAVVRTGIRGLSGADVRAAAARGERIRLVASASAAGARVEPVVLPAADPLAQLRGMANAVIFETDLLGEVAVTQLTGGLTQTAYALVSDLTTVARRIRSGS